MRLHETLTDQRIAHDPTGLLLGDAHHLLEAAADAALKREGPHRAALMRQDAHGNLPARTRSADHQVGRDAHVVEEDLAEFRVPRHLLQRPHADPRGAHIDEQQADALVLRRLGLRAAQQETPVRDVSVTGPDLLAVHDKLVTVAVAARAQRAEIGPGAGLRESLAPQISSGQQRFEKSPLLRLSAVVENRRPDEVDGAATGDRSWRADAIELFFEQPALDDCCAAAAMLARP